MNNFIISGSGFLKSTSFNKDTKQVDIEWTKILREAQKFNNKHAVATIKKHKIDAFVWNPYTEEAIKGKWNVIQRENYYDFFNDENHNVLEWIPIKVKMENKTDVDFLLSKGIDNKKYYDSYEEALEVANIKNVEMLNELQSKISILNQNHKI